MVIITVRAAGASPAAINDNYTTDEGTALTTALVGVRATTRERRR
jgi:hypothetical protein